MSRQFVAYYRVSTDRQGRSGLGLDAQREAVFRHLASQAGDLERFPAKLNRGFPIVRE